MPPTETLEVTAEAVTIPAVRVESDSAPLVLRAKGLLIQNDADADAAGEFRKTLSKMEKSIEGEFEPSIKAANAAHKSLTALRGKFTAPLADARKIVDDKIIGWRQAEDRRIREENARIEREQRAKAEEERKAREAAALEQAAALEAAGNAETAAEVIAEALIPELPAPVVTIAAPAKTQSGATMVDKWEAEVVDFKALVAAVAAGTVPITVLMPNDVALGQMARALKAAMAYPGVKVVNRPFLKGSGR